MPKKILIIDDDPVVIKYLEAVFSDNGYATCSATSSGEGLEVFFAHLHFDTVPFFRRPIAQFIGAPGLDQLLENLQRAEM